MNALELKNFFMSKEINKAICNAKCSGLIF